ncbi:hypothetical protein M422DRAFT_160139 [Sphaerobolus stellatus SS14]|nr:hypothetical protein M422DRAFT_160139 [Sphaerobolus stellatus SS14]
MNNKIGGPKLITGSGLDRPLDPCHARAFNPTTVNAHFTLLEAVVSSFDIPVENIYNMDEKGAQLGGRRKASSIKWVFAKGDESHYVLKSDSLLLVTIIEAVCADGTACPPCIIMPLGQTGDWMAAEGLGEDIIIIIFFIWLYC